MPAPLASAAMYFGLPRLLGGLADKAATARAESLISRGADPVQDTLYNLLTLVPTRSGLESTIDALGTLDFFRNMPLQKPYPFEETPSGPQVARELPYDQGVEFLSPMEDFLRYGGRDDDAGGRYYMAPSYGQTDQPATEVRFGPSGAELYGFDQDLPPQQIEIVAPRMTGEGSSSGFFMPSSPPGGAKGGLAALIEARYAKHKR